MFPELPNDLAELTDDELSALRDDFKTVAAKIRDDDPDTLGDLTAEQVLEQMTSGVEAIEAITAELTSRTEAAEAFRNSVAELAARAGAEETPSDDNGDAGDDGDGDPEAVAEVAEPEPVLEPVAA